jgi:hypothetical protein
VIPRMCMRLGLNYAWGLINFTAGAILCGTWVALVLVMHGVVR